MMKPIADDVYKIIRRLLARTHPIIAEIMINWGKIVGAKFHDKSYPLKIIKTTQARQNINILYIKVDNYSFSTEMAFQQDIIIERISVYMGYKAIHKLRFVVT